MNTHKIVDAINLASQAHSDDRWGKLPYLTHLALTAAKAQDLVSASYNIVDLDDVQAAAWLHDVIEDHPEYEQEIAEKFPELLDSLKLVARDENDSYNEFIQKIVDERDPLALAVKISDMYVNMNNNPPKSLLNRYQKNFDKLMKAWVNVHQ